MESTTNSYQPDCCRLCSNNPANNPYASGVCACVLLSMEQWRYSSPTWHYKTTVTKTDFENIGTSTSWTTTWK